MQSSTPDGKATPTQSPTGVSIGKAEITRPIAGDILYGADQIAQYLFGDRKYRRRVYHLVDRSVHNLVEGTLFPHFRIGVNICARKSVLLEWIAGQESGRILKHRRAEADKATS